MGNNYVSDRGWRNTQIAGKSYEKLKDGVKIKVYTASGLSRRTFRRGGSKYFQVNTALK